MPYARRYRKRTGWKKRSNSGAVKQTTKPYKRRTRTGRTTNKKLADKRINTLVEVRMQEIAKQEISKNIKHLTSRKYLFVNYEQATNEFNIMSPPQDLIDWSGKIVEVSNIGKVDNATVPNVPQVDDPLTQQDENADGQGPNQIMSIQNMNGQRFSDTIYVKSLVAHLRIRTPILEDSDLDLFGSIKVHYAFVLLRDDASVVYNPLAVPQPEEMLTSPMPWGYMGKLDKPLEIETNQLNKTVLCKGQCVLNLNNTQTSEKFHTIFKKFDKPLQIIYNERDQNGQQCNKKIYFVVRSTVPTDAGYDGIKPSVFACTKVNYYEA